MSVLQSEELKAKFRQDVAEVRVQMARYIAQEISDDEFKPWRVARGIYTQRQPGVNMVRIKVPLGRVSAVQLRALSGIATRFGDKTAHITTRQDLQLYFVPRQHVADCIEALLQAGFSTREAGGNVVRNVVASPLAGVDPEEAFDITPYAEAIAAHFLYHPATQKMPRKIKIAVSSSPRDSALSAVNDIGLIALTRQGVLGFVVRVGGGLGASPQSAHLLWPFVPANEILPAIEAILRVFNREGDRANSQRARLKFLIRRIGIDSFRHWVDEERLKLPKRKAISVFESEAVLKPAAKTAAPPHDLLWEKHNVTVQKQAGFVAVQISLEGGNLSASQLRALAEASERWSDGEARLTPDQNVVLRNVPRENLAALYEFLRLEDLAHPLAGTLAAVGGCRGATVCRLAVTKADALAEELRSTLQNMLASEELRGATLWISGCPNACGRHHLASIGLHGAAKKINGKSAPYYQLLIGGGINAEGAHFGRVVGRIPARRVPRAVRRLIALYREFHEPDENFASYLQQIGMERVRELLADLLSDEVREGEENFFVDWGDVTPFRIATASSDCA